MKSAILAATIASACAFAPAPTGRSATAVSETKADLEALAKKLNPVVSFISLQSYVEVVHMIYVYMLVNRSDWVLIYLQCISLVSS